MIEGIEAIFNVLIISNNFLIKEGRVILKVSIFLDEKEKAINIFSNLKI